MVDGYKDITLKASLASSGWTVPVTGSYANQLSFLGTTAGTIIINNSVVTNADLWDDYMMVGYANLVTNPASADHRIGFVARYQDSNNYYFLGFKIETTDGGVGDNKSTYEVYKKESGSYSRIENEYDTGNNYSGGVETYYGLPDTVGTSGVLDTNTQIHIRAEVYGTVGKLYISNELVFENTTDFDDFDEGEMGLEVFTQSSTQVTAYFDNIKGAT